MEETTEVIRSLKTWFQNTVEQDIFKGNYKFANDKNIINTFTLYNDYNIYKGHPTTQPCCI